jgi:hypothetical protein
MSLPFRQRAHLSPQCARYRYSEDPFAIIPHWIARSGEGILGLSQALFTVIVLSWLVRDSQVEDKGVAHIQLVALWQTSCALRNQRRGLETVP